MEDPEELALRAHVRHQLLDYMNEHINIDHIAYTEHLATEFLSKTLHPVSLFDSTTLALPEDPLALLVRQYAAAVGKDYIPTERLAVTNETKAYLLDFNKKSRCVGDPLSTRMMMSDAHDSFELPRPASPPLLTRAAYNATRRLLVEPAKKGKMTKKKASEALSKELDRLQMSVLDIPTLESDDIGNIEDILGLRLQLSAEEAQATKDLVSEASRVQRPPSSFSAARNHLSSSAREFLYSDPPIDDEIYHDLCAPLSPPLFPRKALPIASNRPEETLNTVSLANFVRAAGPPLPTKEDDASDMARENMTIIDGWTAYLPNEISALLSTSKPPSLQSPGPSDHEDQLDELMWDPTPPDAQPIPDIAIASYKMDDYEIPRVNRPGAPLPSAADASADTRESWKSLLHPLPDLEIPLTPPRTRPQPDISELPVSPSLVGQPPTDAGTDDVQPHHARDVNEDLDTTLKSLYKPLGGARADALIMEAKVDDMEQILIDVPKLPEPTVHAPPRLTLPTDFQSLLAPPKRKKDASDHISHDAGRLPSVRLAKIPGLASLNLELSWRPIVSGTSVPTQEQLAGVSTLGNALDQDMAIGEKIADHFTAALTTRTPAPFREGEEPRIIPLSPREGLILTRAERQLIHGTFGGLERAGDTDDIELDVVPVQDDEELFSPAPPSPLGREAFIPQKRPYQASHPDTVLPSPSKYRRIAMQDLATAHSQLSQITCSSAPSSQMRATPTLAQVAQVLNDHPDARSSERISLDSLHASQTDGQHSCRADLVEHSPSIIHQSHSRDRALSPAYLTPESPITLHTEIAHPASSHLAPPSENRLSKLVQASITNFRLLKGHTVSEAEHQAETVDHLAPDTPPPDAPAPDSLKKSVLSNNSIVLPPTWQSPSSTHRYVASFDLIQKRRIASALSRMEIGRVELVEHSALHSSAAPDLILDPQHAVIFFSLSYLPSSGRELMARLKGLLPSYDNILLVFEAYPPSQSFSLPTTGGSVIRRMTGSTEQMGERAQATQIDVLSPPVVQALRRFRRELLIEQELISDDVTDISIETVCALSPEEAAMYTRLYGDRAEGECYEREVGKALWGSRSWLQEEEDENANDLASFPRMNIFAAAFILSRVTPVQFLELDPAARREYLGPLLGNTRIDHVNEELESRAKAQADSEPFSPSNDDTLRFEGDERPSSPSTAI